MEIGKGKFVRSASLYSFLVKVRAFRTERSY
jgi:hypothetical protein